MSAPDVRERHGVMAQGDDTNCLTITDCGGCVSVAVYDGFGARLVFITPNEARHVANQLRRLARRIDERILDK